MRRSLIAALAVSVLAGSGPAHAATPVPTDAVRELHNQASNLAKQERQLEAGRTWLEALAGVAPTAGEIERVKTLYCSAMRALDIAASSQGQLADVRGELDERRALLEPYAALLADHERHEDVETCLEQGRRLSQPAADVSAPKPEVVVPVDIPQKPRPTPRKTRGLAAGVGVSASLMGVSSVLIAVGYTSMKSAYRDVQNAADEAAAAGVPLMTDQDLCAGDLGGAIESACSAHGRGKATAIAGLAGLGVSAVATAVFAALLVRARRPANPERVSAHVTPMLGGGAMVGGSWRF